MQFLFIMTRLSSAETLIFTLVIFQRPTNVSITITVLQSHKPVCDFMMVLCSYIYVFSFVRPNVSPSHFYVSHLLIDSPSARSITAQWSHFNVLYVNSRPHIFKHQILSCIWVNMVLRTTGTDHHTLNFNAQSRNG